MNRVALIGCGAVAETGHLPAMLRHAAFAIAAVCDVREDRARRLAQHAGGVPHYTDWRAMLDGGQFDAAVLALPPEISADVAIDCLRRGLSVLDEKPLAATLEEGRRVARAVTETGACSNWASYSAMASGSMRSRDWPARSADR